MVEDKKIINDETGIIRTEELRDVLESNAKENKKKESWFKKLFKRKDKKNK
ncbi:MAG: hypothetical protein SOU19_09345 [Candidatus Caccosoma sp.]|nr:hypothetical protein [Candidatus Caccosoma sp.]